MTGTRCQTIVQERLTELGVPYRTVALGLAEVEEELPGEQYRQLRLALLKSGLELVETRKAAIIEKTKEAIEALVRDVGELRRTRNSAYLSARLQYDYTYLANLFSEVTGTTIERFIIGHKIERVKELLLERELSLTQISYKLNYSSVAHLSNQFKKVTGLTPTVFKQLHYQKQPTQDCGNGVSFFCNCVRIPASQGVSFVACR